MEMLPMETQSAFPWGLAKRLGSAGAPVTGIPVLQVPFLLEGLRAAHGPRGAGGHFNTDCTGVQRAGQSGMRVTPLRLGWPGGSAIQTPARHAHGCWPWRGCTQGREESLLLMPARGRHLVSSRGNLVSPLGGFRGLELVSLRSPKSAL